MDEGPIQVTLNAKVAQLVVHLAQEMGTDDPSAVVRRAIGLLEMAHRMKRQGGRLFFRNENGQESEVAW